MGVHLFGHAHDSFGFTQVSRQTGKPDRQPAFAESKAPPTEEEEDVDDMLEQEAKTAEGTSSGSGVEGGEGTILCVNSATTCHFFDVHLPSSRTPGQWTLEWQDARKKGCTTS